MSGTINGAGSLDLKKLAVASQADIMTVLKAYDLTPRRDVVIRDNLWINARKQYGRAGKFIRGAAVQYLIEYEGIGFEKALKKVLAVCAPAMLEEKRKRMIPKERLRRADGTAALNKFVAEIMAGRKTDERPKLPREATDRSGDIMEALVRVRRLDATLVRELFEAGTLWASRNNAVFSSLDDKGNRAWSFVLPARNIANGAPTEDAVNFAQRPWYWGNEEAETAHVFTSPAQAAGYASRLIGNEDIGRVRNRAVYVSLTGNDLVSGEEGLYAFLARHPDVRKVELNLDNVNESTILAGRICKVLDGLKYEVTEAPPPQQFTTWLQLLEGRTGINDTVKALQCGIDMLDSATA